MKPMQIYFIILTMVIFALTVAFERILIPILKSHKLGQKILDIGPRWHKSKEGPPIMGGLGFILAMLIAFAVFFVIEAIQGTESQYIPLSSTLAFAVGNGAIGFVDDYTKLIKKQNEGLTWKQKLVLQLALAGAYVCVLSYTGFMDTVIALPFTAHTLDLDWGFYPIAVIVLAGVVNGANITDGIDGLASSVTCVIGIFFAISAFCVNDEQLGLLGGAIIGATLGFLGYNFHPAKVFMGDTGSLFLGGLVIAASFAAGQEWVGLLVSAVYILEMLSSLLQVVYYKLTHGKRLLKMAPVHHHFERCGWSENKILLVFSLVQVAFSIVAWFV